jgi:hypothetical protein
LRSADGALNVADADARFWLRPTLTLPEMCSIVSRSAPRLRSYEVLLSCVSSE